MMDPEESKMGGGSGGGTGMDSHGNNMQSASSTYQIGGNQVVLVSRKALPPGKPGPSVITLLAGGAPIGVPPFGDEGEVDIRGATGVRITSGPPAMPMVSPPVSNGITDGIELVASEKQSISIQRGMTLDCQSIDLTKQSIIVDSGAADVVIRSMKSITLEIFPFGTTSIELTPLGVKIKGPKVQINPVGP